MLYGLEDRGKEEEVNPLAAYFFIPLRGTEIFFINLSLSQTFLNVYCWAQTIFFGARISRAENLSSAPFTVQGKCIYTFFKAENQEIQFRSYVLNLVKINISFFLSKVGSTGADLSACTISSVDLSTNRATIVERDNLLAKRAN